MAKRTPNLLPRGSEDQRVMWLPQANVKVCARAEVPLQAPGDNRFRLLEVPTFLGSWPLPSPSLSGSDLLLPPLTFVMTLDLLRKSRTISHLKILS